MPLPTGAHAQETEYLKQLYDEYCKIALRNIMEAGTAPIGLLRVNPHIPQEVAWFAHSFATAMMEERKK